MNNLIIELKKTLEEVRAEGFHEGALRARVKEVLHYFVLDSIYNSEFKNLIFYGGTSLRVLYSLPRMSEDLDFEGEEPVDFKKLAVYLEEYFKKDLQLRVKVMTNKEANICRIILNFPIMYEIGLSPHREETLRIKVEIRSVLKKYLKRLTPVFTPKSAYGKAFVLRHYDLPTLFGGKLCAILTRPKKGFRAGDKGEEVNYKGRDFFDLIWYMEKGVVPNQEILKLNGIKKSIGAVFEEVSEFIKHMDVRGLQRDLEPLFGSQTFVKNFVETFKESFAHLRDEKYLM